MASCQAARRSGTERKRQAAGRGVNAQAWNGRVVMDEINETFWEGKYAGGHRQGYPWDMVVSFLMRAPRVLGRPATEIRVLELGCGTGANLWCAAREGFEATGVDISATAIDGAKAMFAAEGLAGRFVQSGFSPLPFEDARFDIVIDRGALTCVTLPEIQAALDETRRVLGSGGLFFSQGFSTDHASMASGEAVPGAKGTRRQMTRGTLAGLAQITFLDREDIGALFDTGWTLTQLQHVTIREELSEVPLAHCEWRLVAQKT